MHNYDCECVETCAVFTVLTTYQVFTYTPDESQRTKEEMEMSSLSLPGFPFYIYFTESLAYWCF